MKTAEETLAPDKLGSPPRIKTPGRVPSSKVLSTHLDKLAVVYVRQSTTHQVQENRESTARQYAFAEHAVALGWAKWHVERKTGGAWLRLVKEALAKYSDYRVVCVDKHS
jgi:hypothetical protein